MTSSSDVLLILGAGPRIGSAVALKFASQGFRVAIASRSAVDGTISPNGYLQLQLDLFQPASVPRAFEAVKRHFGTPPGVVVYNGRLTRARNCVCNSHLKKGH